MENSNTYSHDDVAFSKAMQLASSCVLPMALRAAVDLGLFEIMATSDRNFLSPTEITSRIRTNNPEAPDLVGRILRFLASSSVLKCEINKKPNGERLLYGLSPVCNYFIEDQNGFSLAPYTLMDLDKTNVSVWNYLKDAIIDGGSAFSKAHGMGIYEYANKDQKFNNLFNESMSSLASFVMNRLLDVYKGFEGLTQIVDVGGGNGSNLAAIISKYPNIKGINYDLPHVIGDAIAFPGVEHVGGSMFESVPSGEAIFLKHVLHNWSDDECLRLLRNCWKALPKSGKVIVVEAILPQYPDTDNISNNIFRYDLYMLLILPGAKERTEREFDALAKRAGFAATEVICIATDRYVIEFYK